MANEPVSVRNRSVKKRQHDQKFDDVPLPTISADQVAEVELSGTASTVTSSTDLINVGSVPTRMVITSLDVSSVAGTAQVEVETAGGTQRTTFVTESTPFQKHIPIEQGGIHVVPSGGSVVVSAQEPASGTVDNVAANAKLFPIE